MIPRERLNEVAYFQSYGNYVKVFYIDRSQEIIRTTLKLLEDYLPSNYFTRVHHQFIVQLPQIKDYTGNTQGLFIELKSLEQRVKVSRKYLVEFKKQFSSYQKADIIFSKNDPGYFF